jgi:hypothetical protein
MNKNTLETVKKMCSLFEYKERAGNKNDFIYCFTDETLSTKPPEYEAVSDCIFSLNESMDTDSAYTFTFEALEYIRDNEPNDIQEAGHAYADGSTDIYTSDLTAWLNKSVKNVGYIDTFKDELGADGNAISLLSGGQFMARLEAFNAVVAMLESWEENNKNN